MRVLHYYDVGGHEVGIEFSSRFKGLARPAQILGSGNGPVDSRWTRIGKMRRRNGGMIRG
jgi:hypothetical protein